MVSATIPQFRIDERFMLKDIENIESMGVKIFYGSELTRDKFNKIRNDYDYIYIAVGARNGKKLGIEGEDSPRVWDQLTFLKKIKSGKNVNIGQRAAVIGGGNSAIDAARTAKRLAGSDKDAVTLIYRRTINEMPADKEEVEELIHEGISVLELAAPEKIESSGDKLKLTCSKIKLGEPDDSGRRRPVKIHGSNFNLLFDTIITAIGQEVNSDFLPENKLEVNPDNNETQLKNIFAGGDAVRGADSLINAIADGKQTALNILGIKNQENSRDKNDFTKIELKDYQEKLSRKVYGEELNSLPFENKNSFDLVNPVLDEESVVKESSRCLYCDEICNICVSVCPNSANYYYEISPFEMKYPRIYLENGNYDITGWEKFEVKQKYQIININDFCNECGNCDTFCPTGGAPYKVKPKFALNENSFNEIAAGYYLNGNEIKYKENNKIISLVIKEKELKFSDDNTDIIFDREFYPLKISAKHNFTGEINMEKIIEMFFYMTHLNNSILSIN